MAKLINALLVTTLGNIAVITFEQGDISVMHDAVGGHFEVARFNEFDVWVHGEGLLINLPINHVVCELGYADCGQRTTLVGDALVTGGADGEGNTLSVKPEVIEKVRQLKGAAF